jgi:transposase-like protein
MKRRHGEIVHSSVWTPTNKKEVNDMFTNGATVVEICKFLGINKSTWYRWLKDPRKKDFQENVELGQQASEAYWIGVGRNNLENKSFNTALYSFMMVNKFGYRSAYSKQERDITETKTTKFEVKKAVDVDSILEKLLEIDVERPEVLN